MENFIKGYIKNIDKLTLNTWLTNQNIFLNDNELNILYMHLVNDWYEFLYQNPTNILNDLKNKLSNDNYNKLKILYDEYYNKYHHYL